MRILPIVEGDGEKDSIPLLIRRIVASHGLHEVQILRPHKRGDIHKVRRALEASLRVALVEDAPVLWTFDCDDGCAMEVVEELQARVASMRAPTPVRFALMVREFEGLFLAERAALLQRLPLRPDVQFPQYPEAVRGAKEWISRQLPAGQAYKPTVHQASITGRLDLAVLRHCSRSFRHLEKVVVELAKGEF